MPAAGWNAPLGQRQGGVFRLPPPYLWTPPTPQRAKGCTPLTILKQKSKHKKASAAPVGAIALTLFSLLHLKPLSRCATAPPRGAAALASFALQPETVPSCQRFPPRGSWQNRQVLTEGVKFFFLNVSFCIFFAVRYKVSRTSPIFHKNVMTFFVKSGILYLAGTVGPQPLPRT